MPGPPPPPPPMGGGLGPGAGAAPAGRGQLLGAIHKGVALKKTVTNDRSAPITGNVKPGPGGGNVGGNSGGGGRGPLRPANNNGSPTGGGPPLAGLFAGGMPKLKPANQRGNAGNDAPPPPAWDAPGRGASEPPGHGSSNGGKRPFPGDVKNRGPPPQPPPAAFKPAMAAVETDRRKHRNASLKKELSATRIVERGIGKLSSKQEPGRLPASKISQLQGKLEGGAEPVVTMRSMKDESRYKDGTVERATKRLSTAFVESARPEAVVTRDNVSKIKRQLSRHGIEDASSSDGRLSVGSRGNHGKPNLAPRPPSDSSPQQQQRVSRAQSLRAPRSPPVLPPTPQPPGFQSNSIQQQQHASSTSGLNQPPAPPHSMNQYRTLPSKSRPRPPMSRPPPPPSRPPPPPVHAPPPPPPHRTMPAAPGFPPNAAVPANGTQRLQPGPPPTPARNSSMRGAEMFERNFTWRGANEFPRPPPFLARPKVFNSVSVRMAGGGGKAQAPQPPVLQLGNKMYARDTSRC